MTYSTSGMSSPRAATSVATMRGRSFDLNCPRARSRSACDTDGEKTKENSEKIPQQDDRVYDEHRGRVVNAHCTKQEEGLKKKTHRKFHDKKQKTRSCVRRAAGGGHQHTFTNLEYKKRKHHSDRLKPPNYYQRIHWPITPRVPPRSQR